MTEPPQTELVEEVQKKIKALSTRDLQLWSIGLLVMVVLAVGFIALIVPNLVWGSRALNVAGGYLPQLFFGFIALIVLFNIYVVGQRRELNAARQDLVTEIMFSQRAHNLSLIDPLTQIFNRRYLDHVIPKEVTRANRNGAPLTFLLLDLDGFRTVNARYGHKAGDHLLAEAARLLQKTFSAAETVLRYGGDEFLVILPDYTEQQARELAGQVLSAAKRWNEQTGKPYKMAFTCGVASYRHGSDINDVLHSAEQRIAGSRLEAENARRRPQCLVFCDDAETMQTLQPILESLEIGIDVCTNARKRYRCWRAAASRPCWPMPTAQKARRC